MLFLSAFSFVLADETDFQIIPIQHPELGKQFIRAVSGENGAFAWATAHKIVFENNGVKTIFDPSNSPLLKSATIADLAICDGNIWVTQMDSGNGNGIFRFDGNQWQIFKEPEKEGILNNRIKTIHVDNDKVIWFGHEVQGVTRMLENIPMHFSSQKIMHLFENRLLSMHMQHTHLWIGSNNGIVRYRTEIKSNYYLNIDTWTYPDFPARAAYGISTFGYKSLAVGTDTGLAIFDGSSWQLLKKDAGIKALPVIFVVEIGKDLWLGSPAGLQRWQRDNPGKLLCEELPGFQITALSKDDQGNLLVGTNRGAALISFANQR